MELVGRRCLFWTSGGGAFTSSLPFVNDIESCFFRPDSEMSLVSTVIKAEPDLAGGNGERAG